MNAVATGVRTEQPEPGDRRGHRERTWPERIALALPGAFLAVVFGFFFITKTSEAWTATKSVQAILVIVGIIGGWCFWDGCSGDSCRGCGSARRSSP